ncbi:non-specific serine/threonine protein kinase [Trifolium repens]|nr:non-specific serine/threonine protein kinase [Trifolium repens]
MSLLLILNITLLLLFSVTLSSSSTEFVYNRNFNSTNINIYGNATIQNSILTLTNQTFFSIGRAFYPQKLPTKQNKNSSIFLPFATSFIFSISPCKNLPIAHGFAFIFSPSMIINGALSGNYLGLFNRSSSGDDSNHVYAVEFDDFRNEEFDEVNDNHVGVDLNSMVSMYSEPAEFWGGKNGENLEKLKLSSGENYQVWIEFRDFEINVTIAPAGKRKPKKPLISKPINISRVFLDEMYVGFSGSTGKMVDTCRILAWSFSHTNFSIGDALNTKHLPNYVNPKKLMKEDEEGKFEDCKLEYWPHKISYKEICDGTGGFCEENVIGIGTSGKIYKGVLKGGEEVAVKRFNHDTQHGMRGFLAEISSLGRMKHRNLLGFKGWSKGKGGKLILVYDYMENESLDKRIFECEETKLLNWEQRIRVLENVASGVLYLHEGWEFEVLHRDIKASNVLLDKDMNARIGDFGLARLQHQELVTDTTRVVGTLGYMAPELLKVGKPSTATDVYSFRILILEVVCGRRPIVMDEPPLVELESSLMEKGELSNAIDERLKGQIECKYNTVVAERLLHLGLLCASFDSCVRPTMRQVVKALEGVKCTECNEECVHVSLIRKINSNSAASWSKSSTDSARVNFPTLDDILPYKYFSGDSLSVSCLSLEPISDSLSEGR